MQDWHHRRSTDVGLRLGGAMLCGISWLAIRTFVHIRLATLPASPGLLAFALATLGFICASAGSALLTIGHHIFDEVEVSERWRSRPAAKERLEVATPARFDAFGRDAAAAPFEDYYPRMVIGHGRHG